MYNRIEIFEPTAGVTSAPDRGRTIGCKVVKVIGMLPYVPLFRSRRVSSRLFSSLLGVERGPAVGARGDSGEPVRRVFCALLRVSPRPRRFFQGWGRGARLHGHRNGQPHARRAGGPGHCMTYVGAALQLETTPLPGNGRFKNFPRSFGPGIGLARRAALEASSTRAAGRGGAGILFLFGTLPLLPCTMFLSCTRCLWED